MHAAAPLEELVELDDELEALPVVPLVDPTPPPAPEEELDADAPPAPEDELALEALDEEELPPTPEEELELELLEDALPSRTRG